MNQHSNFDLPLSGPGLVLGEEFSGEGLHSHPLPEDIDILIVERRAGQNSIGGGNLISRLKQDNRIKAIALDNKLRWDGGNPSLVLFPAGLAPSEWMGLLPSDGREIPGLAYPEFPNRSGLSPSSLLPFDKEVAQVVLDSIRCHRGELARTSYDIMAHHLAKYWGSLGRYWGIHSGEYAHRLDGDWLGNRSVEEFLTQMSEVVTICISPHSDDAEIAVGGLIRRLLAKGGAVENWVITESHGEKERREKEAREAARALSRGVPGTMEVVFFGISKGELFTNSSASFDERWNSLVHAPSKFTLVLPHKEDRHPTHQLVEKKISTLVSKGEEYREQRINTIYCHSPWSGKWDTYFPSSTNVESSREEAIFALKKRAFGESGVLGELCGQFGGMGRKVNYLERFCRCKVSTSKSASQTKKE